MKNSLWILLLFWTGCNLLNSTEYIVEPASERDVGLIADLKFSDLSMSECGNGKIDSEEDCDGALLGGNTCATITNGDKPLGELQCVHTCDDFDISKCTACGNGKLDEGEACDGSAFTAGTSCEQGGKVGDGSRVRCNGDCTVDYNQCETCGNGELEGAEICDGRDFGGKTCGSFPGYMGSEKNLRCNSTCTAIELSQCERTCGNGKIEENEPCDGDKLREETCASIYPKKIFGKLGCQATCEDFDNSGCREHAFVQVSVGSELGQANHVCGLREDGVVMCWKKGGVFASPAASIFQSISSGANYSCGRKAQTGELECWGGGEPFGGNDVSLKKFHSIDADGDHPCGIEIPSNQLFCYASGSSFSPPAGAYKSLASYINDAKLSDAWVCGVRPDDTVTCSNPNPPNPPWQFRDQNNELKKVTEIDGGADFVCALLQNHLIQCEGEVSFSSGSHYTDISAGGDNNVCGVTIYSTVYCVGLTGNSNPIWRFSQVSVGGHKVVCGITTASDPLGAGAIRCWGNDAPFASKLQ